MIANPDLHESIAMRLRRERIRLDFTEAAFAELCGHNASHVTAWESGESHPSAAALACLARHGVDIMLVLTGTSPSTNPTADEIVLDLTADHQPPIK